MMAPLYQLRTFFVMLAIAFILSEYCVASAPAGTHAAKVDKRQFSDDEIRDRRGWWGFLWNAAKFILG
ncbi:Hypothetical predicted protein [Cloeon dipterum]|uniref:Uncharacterized protein n=1 Tax=Cloeon dipterum TaxID=197152 RepID=A0A8S1DGF9_9INSE|nr:Hypothetical predicted protein [Cloeon dipterum]